MLSAIYAAVAGAYLALYDAGDTATAGFLRSINSSPWRCSGLGSILGNSAPPCSWCYRKCTVFHDYKTIALGTIMIVFMIFLRAGIVPSLAMLIARRTP